MKTITVMGAGNGGFSAAADLSLRGFQVTLFEHPSFAGNIETIRRSGAIGLSTLPSTGLAGGFARPACITTDMEQAIAGSEVIFVIVPAFAHIIFAQAMAPFLRSGQMVILMPGGFGGSILFRKALRAAGGPAGVLVAETSTLPYACRKLDDVSVWIRGRKETFDLAAYPAADTKQVLALVEILYPAVRGARNVLETGLNNLNPFIHPPIVLLNVGSTERGDRVLFYHEGITPAVQHLIEALDRERLALADRFSLSLDPAHRILLTHYGHQGAAGNTFREVAMGNPVYRWSEMPSRIDSRYLTEDIPMSLIPIRALARQADVPCRTMDAVITMTEQVLKKDLVALARTLAELDMEGRTATEILQNL